MPARSRRSQVTDLAALLQARGLPAAHTRQVLGGNAADLLNRIWP
jgi:hypothetical protein